MGDTYPIPDDVPCGASSSSKVTLVLPNCEDYWHILIGQLYALTDPDAYDGNDSDNRDVAATFRTMIDTAVFGDA